MKTNILCRIHLIPQTLLTILSPLPVITFFVGDSRTVGMEEAMQDSDNADTCSYIGKVGEGYYWLANEGIDQLLHLSFQRARCYCCV